MHIYEIVKRLVGEIGPIGEAYTDDERYENLVEMTELVDKLIFDIIQVASNKNSYMASYKKAGVFADNFLAGLGIVE
jgi:hypothetical protein